MIKMSNMQNMECLSSDSTLRKAKFWDKPVSQTKPIQLLSFLKRMEMQGDGKEAKSDAMVLLTAIRKSIASGEISKSPLEKFQIEEDKVSLSKIRSQLIELSNDRRDAVTFSITSGFTLDEVTRLKWSDVRSLKFDARSQELLKCRPISIKTSLIFWEYIGTRLAPLLNLKVSLENSTDKTVGEFREMLEDEKASMSKENYLLMRRAFWKEFL